MSETLTLAGPLAGAETLDAPAPTQSRIRFDARDRDLLILGLRKVVLTILTLGLYHFWGRAEIKRALYRAIRIDGHALTWTGNGPESLKTFLIATFVSTPGLALLIWYFVFSEAGSGLGIPNSFALRRVLIGMPLLFLIGSAVYRRRTHVLRRSWIRGERFTMTGHAWSYARLHFWTSFVVPLTLGWALPWRTEKLAARITRETAYGDTHFSYAADRRALMKPFAWVWATAALVYAWMIIMLALAIGPELTQAAQTRIFSALKSWDVLARAAPILGTALAAFYCIAKAWYARVLRHQAERTTLGALRFALRVPVPEYVWMTATNAVLRVLSLGILTPWCEARHWRFLIAHLQINGPLPNSSR
jgi:uncharacterized membrane protein YjgN (DUF898 family)